MSALPALPDKQEGKTARNGKSVSPTRTHESGAAKARRERRETFLDSLRSGSTVKEAADAAGIAISTPYYWSDEDPQFSDDWAAAIKGAIAVAESAVFDAGKKDWRAAEAWLKAHSKEKWGTTIAKTELTGANGGPIVTRIELVAPDNSTD